METAYWSHCSSWLKLFSGVIPLFFSLRDSFPSRYFRCVHLCSRPTILAFSQSISSVHVHVCLASPPSFVFIRVLADSMSPVFRSSLVRRTLLWCYFHQDSHFREVSPAYLPLLHGMLYITWLFLCPNGVFALAVRSFTHFPVLFATLNPCFRAILFNWGVKLGMICITLCLFEKLHKN